MDVICAKDIIRDAIKEPKAKIAICYWGLTRSTKKVYQSHYDKLFRVLNEHQIQYDVFMHTWYIEGNQRVWWKELNVPIDYKEYVLLNPSYYQIDNQDVFTANICLNEYTPSENLGDEWSQPILILNLICALESQKRVVEMISNSQNKYDIIIYVRPDAFIHTEVPIHHILNLEEGDIILPDCDHFLGYNDRFAILRYQSGLVYGSRIDRLKEYRRSIGKITSEKYLKYICDTNEFRPIMVKFDFDLVRP